MINQQEAAIFLEQEMPELQIDNTADGNIYRGMRKLLLHTAGKVCEHNYNAAAQCFKLASSLHERGNEVVKNTVENVFVFSISSLLHLANKDRAKLISIIPASLYTLYLSQACHTGY